MYPLVQTNWKQVLSPIEVRALGWLADGPMYKTGIFWQRNNSQRIGYKLCAELKTKGLIHEDHKFIKISPKGEMVNDTLREKTVMKTFEIQAEYIELHTIEIQAETEQAAIKKFEQGDFDGEHFHGSELHEFKSIKEA